MKVAKRVFLFLITNILIVATLSIVLSLLGVAPYIERNGINFESLMVFCLVWGFGGALISLAMSRVIAKFAMGVQVIDPNDARYRSLVQKVHSLCKAAGISTMPQVGVYE